MVGKTMRNIYRVLTITSLTAISLLFLMTYTALAKELPVLVDISELNGNYDGRRVAVMAWARSAQTLRGRRGSHYVKTEITEAEESMIVFTDFPPLNVVNNRVIVQGVYHHRGRYAGFLGDRFIVADTVFREWG
jgi:hypothetical protein